MRLAVIGLWGVVGLVFLCGCISTPRPPLGEGHDFGQNNRNLYVAMGDSITFGDQYGNYPALLSGLMNRQVVNLGVGGATSLDGAQKIANVLTQYRPGYLLILYGANDVISQKGRDVMAVRLQHIVRAAKQNKTIPVLATLLPMTDSHKIFQGEVERRSAIIRALAKEENVPLCDLEQDFKAAGALWGGFLQEDGLHPNTAGLKLIAERFYNVLK